MTLRNIKTTDPRDIPTIVVVDMGVLAATLASVEFVCDGVGGIIVVLLLSVGDLLVPVTVVVVASELSEPPIDVEMILARVSD